MIKPFPRLALIVSLFLAAVAVEARAQDASASKTYVPADGAAPWYDRADWTLGGVPDSLKGAGPVAQQSCTSRSVVLPSGPAAALIGVYEKDAAAFDALGLQATKTGETFAVKNASGVTLNYGVYRVASPPAKIGGAFTAGPVLLKVEGGSAPPPAAAQPSPAAPVPAPAPAPAPSAAAPGDKTYVVADGAAPWYDRSDWALSGVPDAVRGTSPVAQQSCTSRSVAVPGTPKAVLIGVCEKDLAAFDALGLQAAKTGDTFVVKNPAGISLSYLVYRVAAPPAKIGGPLSAGLVLLKVEADGAAPAPSAAAAPVRGPFETGEAGKFHIYLLIGQSNMVGRDVAGIGSQTPDPRVGSLDASGRWVVAVEPLYTGGSGFGPGTFFAASLLASDPGGRIGLVPCAVGGTPLSRWVKGADLYEAAVKRAKLAQAAGTLEGVLWHQGESDSLDAALANSYETRLTQMFQDLRTDLGAPTLPIVVGQLGAFIDAPFADTVRAALKDIPHAVPNTGYADSEGLGDKGDHLHFTVASQKEMGARYAAAMQPLLRQRGSGLAATAVQ